MKHRKKHGIRGVTWLCGNSVGRPVGAGSNLLDGLLRFQVRPPSAERQTRIGNTPEGGYLADRIL
jgi:hypothetical protein